MSEQAETIQLAAAEAGDAAPESHGAEAAQGAHHGDDHHGEVEYVFPYEIPHTAMLIEAAVNPKMVQHDGHRPHPTHLWFINPLFSLALAGVVVLLLRRALRNRSARHPGKAQLAVEMLFQGLTNFFGKVTGAHNARQHMPYLGSLWLFIFANNVGVIFPGMKSPTASLATTAGLAITTMIYIRYHNLKALGLKGYLYHLAGEPKGLSWIAAPILFVIELLGEIIKPASLALRLYGNIYGEDKLLATFLGMGVLIVALLANTPTPWVGLPLHLPFLFLVLLLSTIQATVFTLLASIYLALMMPHEHEEEAVGEPEVKA